MPVTGGWQVFCVFERVPKQMLEITDINRLIGNVTTKNSTVSKGNRTRYSRKVLKVQIDFGKDKSSFFVSHCRYQAGFCTKSLLNQFPNNLQRSPVCRDWKGNRQ